MGSPTAEVNLTKAEQAALDIIKGHRALIKTMLDYKVEDDEVPGAPKKIDYHDIDFYLDQIADPTAKRPSRSAYYFSLSNNPRPSVVQKTNLKTGKVHAHKSGQSRNTRHKGVDYQHTLKTSTTLLPPEPEYMSLFGYDAVGFLWDIDACHLKKEKYVWDTDGMTDNCGWLSPSPTGVPSHPEDLKISSIAAVREKNNKAVQEKKIIELNEILAGLPKGRVDAVFATRDSSECRLRAWNVMLHTKEKLKLDHDLPVLIIASDHTDGYPRACRVYTAAEREKDLEACKIKPMVSKPAVKKKKIDSQKTTEIPAKSLIFFGTLATVAVALILLCVFAPPVGAVASTILGYLGITTNAAFAGLAVTAVGALAKIVKDIFPYLKTLFISKLPDAVKSGFNSSDIFDTLTKNPLVSKLSSVSDKKSEGKVAAAKSSLKAAEHLRFAYAGVRENHSSTCELHTSAPACV